MAASRRFLDESGARANASVRERTAQTTYLSTNTLPDMYQNRPKIGTYFNEVLATQTVFRGKNCVVGARVGGRCGGCRARAAPYDAKERQVQIGLVIGDHHGRAVKLCVVPILLFQRAAWSTTERAQC